MTAFDTLRRKLRGAAVNAYLGTPGQAARSAVAEARRRAAGAARRVDFYHDVADPGSYLVAQVVERLLRAYPVELGFHLVGPPASDVDPAPELRVRHAVRDAADVALHWDVDFPARKGELDTQAVRRAAAVLVRERPAADQLRIAVELGRALWASDGKQLAALTGAHGAEGLGSVPPTLAAAYNELRTRGHYQAATIGYGGDWYSGVSRLPYLEARLARELGVDAPPLLAPRPEAARPPARLAKEDRVPVDFWFSFRSPYSYLALAGVADLAARYPIDLRIRPILPLVERGGQLPPVKRLAIGRDAKREAERLGIPFGHICDPLGPGNDNCLAIAKAAIADGKGLDFLRSAALGIWAEARDMASYVDLRAVVERAGLSWTDARTSLGDPSWKAWAKANADDLGVAGLWGVPSFRAGDYVTWGQDRLPMLEDRLRRHGAAGGPTSR